jgi:acetoin utilization protein AcuC
MWVFSSSHPTQGRRFTNAKLLLEELTKERQLQVEVKSPYQVSREDLIRVHKDVYVRQVLDFKNSGEWIGENPELANLSQLFVGGTLTALDALLRGKTKTAVHFPGAKHHAQYDRSSGFCVFNDFAIAADIATKDHGLNVLIIDIDAHHGDGVENLTADNPKVVTFSIHDGNIFPGTGFNDKEGSFYNRPLPRGAGDRELLTSLDDLFTTLSRLRAERNWVPDLLFLTCGADGHSEDPLSTLNYSVEGYESAARRIREKYADIPILMGGAGGYLPDTRTPEIWAKVAMQLANQYE